MITPGRFQADDDAGQIDQLLNKPGAVGVGVGKLLRLVRGAVFADGEDQLLGADIDSGEKLFGFLNNFFRLKGHDVYL